MHARSQPHGRRPTLSQGGAALIMVLTCLVLVTALALALLNRVEADRTSSAAYKGGANSRNLSEYAVNVVMAQITAATTGANAGNAWASQPGAVRVYSAASFLGTAHITAGELIADRLLSPTEVSLQP